MAEFCRQPSRCLKCKQIVTRPLIADVLAEEVLAEGSVTNVGLTDFLNNETETLTVWADQRAGRRVRIVVAKEEKPTDGGQG